MRKLALTLLCSKCRQPILHIFKDYLYGVNEVELDDVENAACSQHRLSLLVPPSLSEALAHSLNMFSDFDKSE